MSRVSKKSLTRISKRSRRVPDEGQLVIVTNPFTEEETVGTVSSLLSTQFTYTDGDGNTLFAFYDYPWESA